MSGARHILIRVDASSRIGGGHVMRCLTLANALAEAGQRVTFACASIPDFLARQVEDSGHRLLIIAPVDELMVETEQWDSAILSGHAQREDAARALAATGDADWIVLDHYRLDGEWLDGADAGGAKRLILDDLANRWLPCDLLVDQTLGRVRSDYAPWVPRECTVLAGSQYALLRPEFAAARAASLRRRKGTGAVERLLVCLGATDIGGMTDRALHLLLDADLDCTFDVVLAPGAASMDAVRTLAERDKRIGLHVDRREMASLMASADLAIGAPGTSSWERCCLGLPAITLKLADNQALVSQSLARAGATTAVERIEDIGGIVADLKSDPQRMMRMIAASAAIVDGAGAGRIVARMLGAEVKRVEPIEVRPVSPEDSPTLWAWRNDPLVRAMAKTGEPIIWPDHERWFSAALANGDKEILIVSLRSEPAAVVRFDRMGADASISIYANPAMRGRGVGALALARTCEAFTSRHPALTLIADVRSENWASQRIFEAEGFREEGRAEPGYRRYVKRPVGAA